MRIVRKLCAQRIYILTFVPNIFVVTSTLNYLNSGFCMNLQANGSDWEQRNSGYKFD